MNIVMQDIEKVIPYVNNPRNNEGAIDKVAGSIKEFGFKVPIVVDKDNVVITGHTRLLASKRLGLKEVPTIKADDLTEAQVKAFRIADNKVSEFAEWDMDMLKIEMEQLQEMDFDLSMTGFELSDIELDIMNDGEDEEQEQEVYTKQINIPHYEITGECPAIDMLVDETKKDELVRKIEASNVDEEIKEFLVKSAQRHLAFNYQNVAEFYAHADREVQELMEDSALVIIDYNDAIRNGYTKFKEEIEDILEGELNV